MSQQNIKEQHSKNSNSFRNNVDSFKKHLEKFNFEEIWTFFENHMLLKNELKNTNITFAEAIQALYEHMLNFRFKPEQQKLIEYRISRNCIYISYSATYHTKFIAPFDLSDLNDNEISIAIAFANKVIERKHNLEKFLKSQTLTQLQNYYKQSFELIIIFCLPIKEILDCLSKSRLLIYIPFKSCNSKLLAELLCIPKEIFDNLINLCYKNELNETEIRIVDYFINIFKRQKENYSDDDAIILAFTKIFEIFPTFKYGIIDLDKIQLKFNMDDILYRTNSDIIADSLKFPIEKLQILIEYISKLCNKIELNELENKLLNFLIATSKEIDLNPQNNNSYIEFFRDVLEFYPNILSIISFEKYLSNIDNNKIESFFENPVLLKNEYEDIDLIEKLYILYDFILNSKFTPEQKSLAQKIINANEKIINVNFFIQVIKPVLKFNLSYIKILIERINNLNNFLCNMDINKLKTFFDDIDMINKLSNNFFMSHKYVKKNISNIIFNYENKKNISDEFKEGFGINLPNTDCPKLEPVDESQEINK